MTLYTFYVHTVNIENRVTTVIKVLLYFLPCILFLQTGASTSESSLYHDLAMRVRSLSSSKKEIRVAVIPRPGHDPAFRPDLLHVSRRLASELASLKSHSTPNMDKVFKYILENNYYKGRVISTYKLTDLGKKFSLDLIIHCNVQTKNKRKEVSAEVISPYTGRVLLAATSWRIKQSGIDVLKNTSKQSSSTKYSIQAFSIFKSDNTFHTISGRLENLSDETLSRPILSVYIHFSGSSRIIVVKVSCDRDLEPEEILPFRGIIKNLPDLPHQFQIVYQPKISRKKNKVPRLTSSKVSFTLQEKTSQFLLKGVLASKEKKTIYFPSVIVSFFDKKGRFCGSARGFCRLKKLPPHGTSSFKVRVQRSSLKTEPESYQIQYAGLLSP